MSDSPTIHLQRCLDRLRAGDADARNDLLTASADRLTALTRKMLGDYRRVRRWEETGDVLQNALVRLNRALGAVAPPTARDFYRLAAAQIRRELIDLSRHHYGPQGAGAHHASQPGDTASPPLYEAADVSPGPADLGMWTEFHGAVEKLPDEDRETFDLLFYQGLSQEEAAQLLGVAVRTIKRRWQTARLTLHETLGGLPGL